MMEQFITWALQFLIGVVLARIWVQLDKNTEALNSLSVKMMENYATKYSVELMRTEFDKSIHDIRDELTPIGNKIYHLEQISK